jgi:hypothetical protein
MRRLTNAECVGALGLLPIAGVLLACSAQVETDYRGEPVATLHGFVASRAALESEPHLRAAILWGTSEPRLIGEHVAVSGTFPASFSLDVYAAPPKEAELKTFGMDYCVDGEELSSIEPGAPCAGQRIPAGTGLGMWQGFLAAIDSDLEEGEVQRDDIAGIDVDHMLVYYDHDDPRGSPLPKEPSVEQLAQRLELISLDQPEHRQGYERGYSLVKFNPEYRAWEQQNQECKWQGMCVHWIFDADYQDARDWDFQRCTERFPENPTCSARPEYASDGESEASAECRAQYDAIGHDCRSSTSEPALIDNPDGLDDPITIQLGKTFWDAAW